ncbi:type VI secretion system-associated protein TagF [Sulfitobacter sediminilitoris]|uniref:type VI secretion system-associated protein TagF n=1 Tax=Sulfitobacter sediminilitoris TaxID=2698830 RepID=UPI00361FF8ED
MEQGFGAFGKMPALGDFFHLNAPPGFVRIWDNWLQGAMVAAAEAGRDAWDDQYMSAPIWRFTLSAGLAGATKVIGVLMPSVDRVGRRFPLVLMAAVEREGPATLDHLSEDETFEKLEDIALAALEDGMDRDRLSALLAEIAPPPAHRYAPLRRAGGGYVITQAQETGIAPELAAGLLVAGAWLSPACGALFWTALAAP